MGTRCAPNYAIIIFMAELEEEFLATITLQPRIWKRFIDDIFIIWNHGEMELKHLLVKPEPISSNNQVHRRRQ